MPQVDDPRDVDREIVRFFTPRADAAWRALPPGFRESRGGFRDHYAWAIHRHGVTADELDEWLGRRYSAADAMDPDLQKRRFVPKPLRKIREMGWEDDPATWGEGDEREDVVDVFARVQQEQRSKTA
jgi:hypothetical protein